MKLAHTHLQGFLLQLFLCLSMGAAVAGQTCTETKPSTETVQKAFQAAYKVHERLETLQPKVALIARVGQDLSKYGLRYSHIAFVVKDGGSKQWRTLHLLNTCDTGDSKIWREGLANFFLDDLHAFDALLLIPESELQNRLLLSLGNDSGIKALHSSRYNMLAYPYSTKYQNSNQWVLETLTQSLATQARIQTREQAQQWLKLTGYTPTTLKLSATTRLGGRMFRANIAFDDHPNERRYADLIDTVTVESMVSYLTAQDKQLKVELLQN